jgi:hypothetical protein
MAAPGSPASYANAPAVPAEFLTPVKESEFPEGVCPPGYCYPPQLGSTRTGPVPIPGYKDAFNPISRIAIRDWVMGRGPLALD